MVVVHRESTTIESMGLAGGGTYFGLDLLDLWWMLSAMAVSLQSDSLLLTFSTVVDIFAAIRLAARHWREQSRWCSVSMSP